MRKIMHTAGYFCPAAYCILINALWRGGIFRGSEIDLAVFAVILYPISAVVGSICIAGNRKLHTIIYTLYVALSGYIALVAMMGGLLLWLICLAGAVTAFIALSIKISSKRTF